MLVSYPGTPFPWGIVSLWELFSWAALCFDWAGADLAPGGMAFSTLPDILLSLCQGWIISVSVLQAAESTPLLLQQG